MPGGSEHTYQATFPIYALSFSNKVTQAQNSNFQTTSEILMAIGSFKESSNCI